MSICNATVEVKDYNRRAPNTTHRMCGAEAGASGLCRRHETIALKHMERLRTARRIARKRASA